jgi:hypothetical protein
MMVTPPPKGAYQSAAHKRALAKQESAPIQVGVPGAASHGRSLLAKGPKDMADATNAGLKKRVGSAKTTLPPEHAP